MSEYFQQETRVQPVIQDPQPRRRAGGALRRAVPLLAAAAGGGGNTLARSGSLSVQEIYRRSAAGVVKVTAGSSGAGGRLGFGSGFVTDADGYIVTNYHVVEDSSTVSVGFDDDSELSATVVGTDPSTDLALLKVEPEQPLTALPLGDSNALTVGDDVVAIGNPFGLERTVTAGIVSALGRRIQAPDSFGIEDAIQTDAALNSGNSGGPLLDASARVIGVNSQIASENGGNVGIGYAVPVNTVRDVVRELKADGKVERAYLGIRMETADGGARVTEVRDSSPAERAGVERGQVVLAADGEAIATVEELGSAVAAKKPGDTLTLRVRRDGSTENITVTLGERPS
ncbi:MAG: trypsin-like peptidase domain-containing protein [Actinobacteria bacterium]|nr:trypsin-like peptidase domain-containing protein [Actinomycetota bacterium]